MIKKIPGVPLPYTWGKCHRYLLDNREAGKKAFVGVPEFWGILSNIGLLWSLVKPASFPGWDGSCLI